MEIRKTTNSDLDRVMEIYAHARKFMAEHGNPNQWGPTNWPPEQLIKQDIAKGCSYVCENEAGFVIGTFFFNKGKDIEPNYLNIEDGQWIGDSNYGVVHRIASDGSEKGIGSFCIKWAFDQCGHIRIDTHGDNIVMQNMLKKNGFTHCGTIHVDEDDNPRMAFEKINMRNRNAKEFYEALCNSTVDKAGSDIDKSSSEAGKPEHTSCKHFGVLGAIGSFILVLILRKRLVAYKKERRSNKN
ncbi:GNAT family N-acetyltransferase [Butyrivibrio sp.]|uniref:GNAT family N-acetyltransferase n=1 Tax=Butyrivibrio sp. TaxID=28121 RepID=UPI002ED34702